MSVSFYPPARLNNIIKSHAAEMRTHLHINKRRAQSHSQNGDPDSVNWSLDVELLQEAH